MPNFGVLQGGQAVETKAAKGGVIIPFVRAAHEHREVFVDDSTAIAAAAISKGPFDVPAYGYLKSILLVVQCSGGVLGAGALAEDYPFALLDQITLSDVNGFNLLQLTGYQLYLADLIGGYAWQSDPTDHPDYVATINGIFLLRVPVEVTAWDAYGSLPNENAAQSYKFRYTLAASGTAFTTAPTTAPTVRVRAYAEAWSHPTPVDLLGNAQDTAPPGLGTTQYWTTQAASIAVGDKDIQISRVGNLIRNLVLIGRATATGLRANTVLPDPSTLRWDNRDLDAATPAILRRTSWFERAGQALPTGVQVYDFTHDQDGHVGNENRHLWLPTVQATRLQVVGTYAAAGDLQILVNDVAPSIAGR